jgi:hypothetical protein
MVVGFLWDDRPSGGFGCSLVLISEASSKSFRVNLERKKQMTPARPRARSLRFNDKSTIERSQGQSRSTGFAIRVEAQSQSPWVLLLGYNLAQPPVVVFGFSLFCGLSNWPICPSSPFLRIMGLIPYPDRHGPLVCLSM